MKKALLLASYLILGNVCLLFGQVQISCSTMSSATICYPDSTGCTLNNNYLDNQDYVKTYTSDNGSRLKIEFTAFDLENTYDFVYVYDGNTPDPARLLGTFTGSSTPPSLISNVDSITIRFFSDYSETRTGFQATIKCEGNSPPTITTTYPFDNEHIAPTDKNLSIEFNEVVNAVAGKTLSIYKDNNLFESIDVSGSQISGSGTNSISINPTNTLTTGSYYITITSGAFEDDGGLSLQEITNSTTWNFTVTDLAFDGIAGKALSLSSQDDMVLINNSNQLGLTNEFTMEGWLKVENASLSQNLMANSDGVNGYIIAVENGQVLVSFFDNTGKNFHRIDGFILENEWTHIAVSWQKNSFIALYVNGEEIYKETIDIPNPLNVTTFIAVGSASSDVKREIDEVRIWNVAKSKAEIRENMHLTLRPEVSNLVAYWQVNNAFQDSKGIYDGLLYNNGVFSMNIPTSSSSVPVSSGFSAQQTISSATFSSGNISFPNTNLEIELSAYSAQEDLDLVVYKLDNSPNNVPQDVLDNYHDYWIVRQYGFASFDRDMKFEPTGFIQNTDQTKPRNLSLHQREVNADDSWTFIREGVQANTSTQTVSFGEFVGSNHEMVKQFAISHGNARQLDSLALVQLYQSTNGANWDSKWTLSSRMDNWDGVELENGRVVKVELFENNLVGTLPTGLNRLSKLRILNLRSNKIEGDIPASLGNLENLTVLNLRSNLLSGTVPTNLGNLSDLTNLILSFNELDELPSFVGSSLIDLQLLAVDFNKFTFEDLTPNVGVFPDFNYTPQQDLDEAENRQVNEGTNVTLTTTAGGTGNQYQWLKNDEKLGEPSSRGTLTIQNFQGEDIGTYTCEVTNTAAPDLTLVRNPIIITTGLSEADSLALVAIYNATGGDNWTTKWDFATPVSTWYGVELVNNSRVQRLLLNNNNLVGSIPNEIQHLTELAHLDLKNNELEGSLPTMIGNMTNLQFIYLQNNLFSGEVPASWGNLINLEELSLRGNDLEGEIPPSFANLLNVKVLQFQNNHFTGLPNLSSLSLRLQELSVSNNALTFGDIEPNIGVTPDFSYAPQDEINENENLSAVWMTSISMSTEVDGTANVYQWKKNNVTLGDSSSTKTLTINPLGYTDAGVYTCEVSNSKVPDLVLERRSITLTVEPPGINEQDSLALVALYNSTDGDNWEVSWDIANTPVEEWFGITVVNGRVTRILLPSNDLAGEIPSQIGNLTALQSLNLRSNNMTGTIPQQIGNLTKLTTLSLHTNQLEGTIPNALSSLVLLEQLDLHNNELTGALPTFWENLPKLTKLILFNNELQGTVPPEIALLPNLTELNLTENALSGKLPEELANLSKLQSLYLEQNQFTHLPDLSKLKDLADLWVNNNLLTFEDLEPNTGIFADFRYAPQTVREPLEITINSRETLDLFEAVEGAYNLYQWFFEDEAITSISLDNLVLTLEDVSFRDAGTYQVQVSNSRAEELILTYEFELGVRPNAPAVQAPEPYCLGDTVLVLRISEQDGELTRWYGNESLTDTLGEGESIRLEIGDDRKTVYAVNVAGDLQSEAIAIPIVLRPSLELQGNTLVASQDTSITNYQWHLDREEIEGQNTNTLSVTGDGIYSVTVLTDLGCSATSKNIRIVNGQLVTALEGEDLAQNLRIFPNPSQGVFQLELNNTYRGALTLKVHDLVGKTLIMNQLDKMQNQLSEQLDLRLLPKGMYLLEISGTKQRLVKKLIVK